MKMIITEDIKQIMDEMKEGCKSPVLTTEEQIAYDQIMAGFVQCFKPRDFFEQCLLQEATNATWEYRRYVRHQTLLIERRFSQTAEYQEKRQRLVAEKRQSLKRAQAEHAEQQKNGELTPDFRKFDLEWKLQEGIEEILELLDADATERDHARALEAGIAYYTSLADLKETALDCRNQCFEQLDLYREGVGSQLRNVSDQIIEAEFSTIQNTKAPLAPADDQHDDITPAVEPIKEPEQ